mgnify:CR=1 FL=1
MEVSSFNRPTTHYDEKIYEIDKKICELIKECKDISNNNPGYPPLKYISKWADEFICHILKYFICATNTQIEICRDV